MVVLIGFLLIKASPIDQVERLIDQGEFSMDNQKYKEIYEKTASLHQLDLPYFYFSVTTRNYNRAYFDLILAQEKDFYKNFLGKGHSFSSIDNFYKKVKKQSQIAEIQDKIPLGLLLFSETTAEMASEMNTLHKSSTDSYANLKSAYDELISSKSITSKLIPKIFWHGSSNQYHLSLTRIIKGDLGISMRDGRPVFMKIWQRLLLSLLMTVMAFFSCFPLAIWLGKKMHIHKEKKWPKIVEGVLFALASIPLFWFATMALVFLTTPEYSKWLNIFPSVSNFDLFMRNGFWLGIFSNIKQLILPILCIIILELAIVVRQMRTLLQKEEDLPYITTAKMKGLSRNQIVKKHANRSARIQMITMMSSGIISSLAGIVVIEYIFNIPGIGRLLLDSINFSDWPVLLGLILMVYILSSLIVLISDIITQKYDPRLNLFGNEG